MPKSIFHLLQHSKLVCRRSFFFVLRKLMYLIDLKSSWTVRRFRKFTNLINQLETFYKLDEGRSLWNSSRMYHLVLGNINHHMKPTRFKIASPLNFSNKFIVLSGKCSKIMCPEPFLANGYLYCKIILLKPCTEVNKPIILELYADTNISFSAQNFSGVSSTQK